jgi:hypothetical protein
VDADRKAFYVVGTSKSEAFQTKDPVQVEDLPGSSAEKAFNGDLFVTKIDIGGGGSTDPGQPTSTPGDVNGDGKVTVVDATLALRIAIHLVEPTPAQLKGADLNGDGQVTVADTTQILRQSVGLGEALKGWMGEGVDG